MKALVGSQRPEVFNLVVDTRQTIFRGHPATGDRKPTRACRGRA